MKRIQINMGLLLMVALALGLLGFAPSTGVTTDPEISAIISNGGSQSVLSASLVSFATVSNGGIQLVSSGGTASGTTVSSGGIQTVSSGGTVSGTSVNALTR